MKILNAACLVFLAPLITCGNQDLNHTSSALVLDTLPTCKSGEFLVYTGSGIACMSLQGFPTVPDCSAAGQLLTYTTAGGFACSAPGMTSLSAADITTVNNTYQTLVALDSTITGLEKNRASPNASYCGTTATATVGRISSGGATGLSAASALCSQVATCGATARMCTVYDVYYSAATGVIKPTDTIAKSWVYMASWQSFGTTTEPTAGLSDNCGGYTSNGAISGWYGAAIKWEVASTGIPALKVYTGPTGANEGAPCGTPLPIACCK